MSGFFYIPVCSTSFYVFFRLFSPFGNCDCFDAALKRSYLVSSALAGRAMTSFDFCLVLDFEATCVERRKIVQSVYQSSSEMAKAFLLQEIVKFPGILLNLQKRKTFFIFCPSYSKSSSQGIFAQK